MTVTTASNMASSVNVDIAQQLAALRKSTLEKLTLSPTVGRYLYGSPPRDHYIAYMTNVYHYACHSAVVIGIAGARAVSRCPKVAQYLLHHAIEETGHEAWALSDLKDLGLSEADVRRSRPSLHCLAMIGMEYYYAAHGNPIALLGWMYTLEALGDDVGHLISAKVQEGLKLGKQGIYFLSGHGEADHDHIKDITDVIVNDVPSEDIAELLYVSNRSAELYLGLINDMPGP